MSRSGASPRRCDHAEGGISAALTCRPPGPLTLMRRATWARSRRGPSPGRTPRATRPPAARRPTASWPPSSPGSAATSACGRPAYVPRSIQGGRSVRSSSSTASTPGGVPAGGPRHDGPPCSGRRAPIRGRARRRVRAGRRGRRGRPPGRRPTPSPRSRRSATRAAAGSVRRTDFNAAQAFDAGAGLPRRPPRSRPRRPRRRRIATRDFGPPAIAPGDRRPGRARASGSTLRRPRAERVDQQVVGESSARTRRAEVEPFRDHRGGLLPRDPIQLTSRLAARRGTRSPGRRRGAGFGRGRRIGRRPGGPTRP